MLPDKRCPAGGDHVWCGTNLIGMVWCLACNKVVSFEEMVEMEGLGQSLLIPPLSTPTEQQSPEQGNFWRGNMEAKKVLHFTRFDPNDKDERLYSESQGMWLTESSVKYEVEDWVEKLIAVMESGENLTVTLEVTEDE